MPANTIVKSIILIQQSGQRDKFCYKHCCSVKYRKFISLTSTLQRRIGMMEPCFLKLSRQYSCMRHDWQVMGCEAQVDSAERRLKPSLKEKVCQRICRTAEKLDMVRIVLWDRN